MQGKNTMANRRIKWQEDNPQDKMKANWYDQENKKQYVFGAGEQDKKKEYLPKRKKKKKRLSIKEAKQYIGCSDEQLYLMIAGKGGYKKLPHIIEFDREELAKYVAGIEKRKLRTKEISKFEQKKKTQTAQSRKKNCEKE